MRRRSRTRRVLKWAGLLVSVLLVVAYVVSVWATVLCRVGSCDFGLSTGLLRVSSGLSFQSHSRLTAYLHEPPSIYRISELTVFSGARNDIVPLWALIVLAALPTALLWWLDRRRIPPGHCRKCGYNLTGNVSGRCPECGERI